MMASHREHVARHLDRLARSCGDAQARAVLDLTSLRLVGAQLTTSQGGDVGPAECAQYLEAVKLVLGDPEYLPARVNFILARCTCLTQPAP